MKKSLFCLAAWFLALAAFAQVPVPPLSARITDLTGTLSAEQKASLESRLENFEKEKGAQIAVFVVPTIKPESIEQYSLKVAEAWKLGRKGVDDGALLIVAKDDRELRIEVGYGLEGLLNDAVANRVIEDVIVPRFRAGDFYGGIDAGVTQMMRVIAGEALPEPEVKREFEFGAILPIVVFAVIAGQILTVFLGRLGGGAVAAGSAGLLVWLFVSSIVLALFVAAAVFVMQLFHGVPARSYRGGWHHGRGSWGGGDFSGGGGFSGSGGFSGGGGSFGGGGASGRW